MSKNMFCNSELLTSEAYVESLFCDRLFSYLGYDDSHIKRKDSLAELTVGGLRGLPQRLYRPDYAFKKNGVIRWVLDAKSPHENLEDHQWQPRAYSMLINGEYPNSNPITHYCLTNGFETLVYAVDRNDPVLRLLFNDFVPGSEKLPQLEELLSWSSLATSDDRPCNSGGVETMMIARQDASIVNAAFAWCHQHIYRKDNISQAAAFVEFVKIMALKLEADKELKRLHPEINVERSIEVPVDEVRFSRAWIDSQSKVANPVSSILFHEFMESMEADIARGNRKRFFPKGAVIDLKPETIRGVVERLQGIYLFGIDADLNGRLFETFLSATMRGKDLGQFFTPRSVVKLGVSIADVKVHEDDGEGRAKTETVLDACCGTGGFLIDVFADMNAKAREKNSLSLEEKDALLNEIKNERIVGVDIGRDPNMAQLARLNMYLHGDGGTRVYHADVLNRDLPDPPNADGELLRDMGEMRSLFALSVNADSDVRSGVFDVVLTNPPFAKVYSMAQESEADILRQYEIGHDKDGTIRQSIKSSLLFFERYHDLLRPGGRLVSVIDDGILSGQDYKWFRDYLRSVFIVKGVVSLPGDAFQRSKARVKTSLLILEKKKEGANEEQGPVFMYPCRYVGNDDPSRQRAMAGDDELRRQAAEEVATVSSLYRDYRLGNCSGRYLVSPKIIADRLDVKHCLFCANRHLDEWQKAGYDLFSLGDIAAPREYENNDDVIVSSDFEGSLTPVIVRYTGKIDAGEDFFPQDSSYSKYYRVHEGDIAISNIAASYGSVAVIPDYLDGCVVTNEYTVLRAKDGFDPGVIQAVLRMPDIRAEILLGATGSNRTRSQWASLKEIVVPYPDKDLENKLKNRIKRIRAIELELRTEEDAVSGDLREAFGLADEESIGILEAFKPPK